MGAVLLEETIVAAGESGLAGEGGLAGGVAEVGVDRGIGVIFLVADGVGGAEDRGEVVGDF